MEFHRLFFLFIFAITTACSQGPMGLHLDTADLKPPSNSKLESDKEPTISFAQVNAFAFQSCADCHSGDEMPDLLSYNDYRLHIDSIAETVLVTKSMPRRKKLSDEQLQMVKQWIEEGAPEFVPNQPPGEEPTVTTTSTTTSTTVPSTTTLPSSTTTTTLPQPPAKITFAQVLATSFQSCTKCHSAGDETPALETYADYKSNLSDINKTVVVKRSMPKKQKLTDAQVQLVKDWIAIGAPEK